MPLPSLSSPPRRSPSILGVALSLLGVMTALGAAALVAAVIWLDVSRAEDVAYGALALRVVVIGGFLLLLAWLLWHVGTSMSGQRVDGAEDGDAIP